MIDGGGERGQEGRGGGNAPRLPRSFSPQFRKQKQQSLEAEIKMHPILFSIKHQIS